MLADSNASEVQVMCAKSRVLRFVSLAALLLILLVLTADRGEAVITSAERDKCSKADVACIDNCGTKATKCRTL
jgi:hypothetical protein